MVVAFRVRFSECSKGICDLCDLKSIWGFFRVLNRYGSSIEGSFNHNLSLMCANNLSLMCANNCD